MNRKHAALLELVKRGGTLNERRVACEKLFLLTGKDYSYFLPKEEQQPETRPAVLPRYDVQELIKKIKDNLPIYEDHMNACWRGSKGLVITLEELHEMSYHDYKMLVAAAAVAINLAGAEKSMAERRDESGNR